MYSYFKLKPDPSKIAEGKDPSDVIKKMETTSFGSEDLSPQEEQEMKKFLAANADIKIKMAVFLYMMDALKFFKKNG